MSGVHRERLSLTESFDEEEDEMAKMAILLLQGILSLGSAFGQNPDLVLHHSSGVVGSGGQTLD